MTGCSLQLTLLAWALLVPQAYAANGECKAKKALDKAKQKYDSSVPQGAPGLSDGTPIQKGSFNSAAGNAQAAAAVAAKCMKDFQEAEKLYKNAKGEAEKELKEEPSCQQVINKAKGGQGDSKWATGQCKSVLDQLEDQGGKDQEREQKMDKNPGQEQGGGEPKDQKPEEKKEEKQEDKGDQGGGGSPPQMPQMPQQQGGDETPPEQAAEYPQKLDSTIQESKQPETVTSPLRGDGPAGGAPSVGFGNTDPNLRSPDSIASAGGAAPALNQFGSGPVFPPTTYSPDRISLDGVRTSAPALGSPAGGSSAGSGSGASSTSSMSSGAAAATEGKNQSAEEANPYLVSNGGGRLSAPGGAKGPDFSETRVDATAKETFSQDFGTGSDRTPADASAGAPEGLAEEGYTIFKMISYRYRQIRMRGAL